jgi:hypothetical protein
MAERSLALCWHLFAHLDGAVADCQLWHLIDQMAQRVFKSWTFVTITLCKGSP